MFVGYELLVGLTPGTGEALSCGLANSVGNGLGFIVVLISTAFLNKETKAASNIVMLILAANVAIAFLLLLKTKTTAIQTN